MLDPSVETKTRGLWWADPEKLFAISSIAAVAAALVTAPLPRATSRGAISAIWRFDSPGRVAIRLRRWTSWPWKLPSKRCSETVAPSIDENCAPTCSAIALSAAEPGVGYAADSASCFASGAALDGSKASGGTPPVREEGTPGNENIATTAARGTESRPILQSRKSITACLLTFRHGARTGADSARGR